ncbi:uncharacterized protein BKA78DRAFT_315537 [Phyllosticta capitalensis]|uniref:uncharacterized protein n=1 Tax=Phyllosticta capitalensis TaxID=121624 RepID=UPI0031329410
MRHFRDLVRSERASCMTKLAQPADTSTTPRPGLVLLHTASTAQELFSRRRATRTRIPCTCRPRSAFAPPRSQQKLGSCRVHPPAANNPTHAASGEMLVDSWPLFACPVMCCKAKIRHYSYGMPLQSSLRVRGLPGKLASWHKHWRLGLTCDFVGAAVAMTSVYVPTG